LENDTHSFVVRIWHELTDREGNIVTWRGSIDHVGSGERAYFHDLYGIVNFIQEQMGLNASCHSRWRSIWAKIRR
jgi:hypothetical protein